MNRVPFLTMKNRKVVETGKKAGCYGCLAIFDVVEIIQYMDGEKTVICPKCGADMVLGEKSGYELSVESLSKINHHWFGKKVGTNI